ncbi:alpha/beta hydrolase [Saccharothrix sp. NRRL B-16314]|uniref:alpha/beta hydrolase n=1 Tax=Saccharothrix sp. NRRL B-16314 TaxID=1463825 RepID=UPI000526482D|nr:alpha/beta hydrolase [Saccharothrix sp. NRRL B-16314]
MVHVTRGGDGPLLVLLHGLGATGSVWRGVAESWPGSWMAVDLPGHGRSAALERYSFGALAAAVAAVVPGGPVAVLGHSLGGVVALTLASGWFGVDVRAAGGVGVKLRWTAEELARAASLAARPARVFGTRAEASAWAGKLAGVPLEDGVVEVGGSGESVGTGGSAGVGRSAEAVGSGGTAGSGGTVEAAGSGGTGGAGGTGGTVKLGGSGESGGSGGWRAALDSGAFGVGAPDVAGLLAVAKAPVFLAAGETDHMCPPEHLRAAQPSGIVLPGVGHNAHVEQPASIKPVLDRLHAALVG